MITIKRDVKRSYLCDQEAVEFAVQAAALAAQLEVTRLAATIEEDTELPPNKKMVKIKPASEIGTKTVDLQTGDPTKTAVIGSALDPK